MREFSIILCIDANNTIDISRNTKEDLKYFKKNIESDDNLVVPLKDQFIQLTTNNIVIMGRKSADSLLVPFKNRLNIVITKEQNYRSNEGFISFTNLNLALDNFKQSNKDKEIFVIGGLQLFDEAIQHYKCRNVYMQKINRSYEGNKLFLSDTFLNILQTFDIQTRENVDTYSDNLRDDVRINIIHYVYKNYEEIKYLNLLDKIITFGELRDTRNAQTYSLFGEKLVFNLQNGFPLLTTKKIFVRGIIEELLFFLRGETNTKLLEEKGVNIWRGNTTKEFLQNNNKNLVEGDMGPMYGYQWRYYNRNYQNKEDKEDKEDSKYVDQLELLIKNIIEDPHSRRLLLTTYNPAQVEEGVLYPCHGLITQFYVKNNRISLQMYQRSSDSFLGLPFNIASYALLLHIIVNLVNNNKNRKHKEDYDVGEVIIIMGDTHIYSDKKADHLSVVKQQISLRNETYRFPKLNINIKLQDLCDITPFSLNNGTF